MAREARARWVGYDGERALRPHRSVLFPDGVVVPW